MIAIPVTASAAPSRSQRSGDCRSASQAQTPLRLLQLAEPPRQRQLSLASLKPALHRRLKSVLHHGRAG